MESLRDLIISTCSDLLPEIVNIRRHLHRYPELSYSEHKTAAFISDYLTKISVDHKTGIAGTGIVGIIRGEESSDGLTIGLRADMDALPVNESGEKDYKSTNEGVMHACGHDAHTAMLLGTAMVLRKLSGRFSGKMILVFQPGEEKAPGGAKLMIESGIFDDLEPDIFLAQHVLPDLPSGYIGYHSGPYMASCDEIYITVKGKGGHAAQPATYTDQIYIASELILILKNTINKEAEINNHSSILGIGDISGRGATNIIPERVTMAGTFRAFNEQWRAHAKSLMHKIARETASRYGVEIDMNIVEGYPVLVNDVSVTDRAMRLSNALFGTGNVVEMPVRMSSEDFSFFSERYPSCLFRLGTTPHGEKPKSLHTPEFDIDESAMMNGVVNMVWLAMNMVTARNRKII